MNSRLKKRKRDSLPEYLRLFSRKEAQQKNLKKIMQMMQKSGRGFIRRKPADIKKNLRARKHLKIKKKKKETKKEKKQKPAKEPKPKKVKKPKEKKPKKWITVQNFQKDLLFLSVFSWHRYLHL